MEFLNHIFIGKNHKRCHLHSFYSLVLYGDKLRTIWAQSWRGADSSAVPQQRDGEGWGVRGKQCYHCGESVIMAVLLWPCWLTDSFTWDHFGQLTSISLCSVDGRAPAEFLITLPCRGDIRGPVFNYSYKKKSLFFYCVHVFCLVLISKSSSQHWRITKCRRINFLLFVRFCLDKTRDTPYSMLTSVRNYFLCMFPPTI